MITTFITLGYVNNYKTNFYLVIQCETVQAGNESFD